MTHYRDGIHPDDHSREEIIRRLGEFFPNGSSPRRFELYITALRKLGFKKKHVAEGVERTICSREQQSFPPLAILVRHCREAQNEAVLAERHDVASAPGERFNDRSLEIFRQARAEAGFPSKAPQPKSQPTRVAEILEKIKADTVDF